jgi:hypothetical protein
VALAGRAGVDLPLDRFDELAATTPLLADVKPSGAYLMEDFFYAGGLPAVLAQIADLLHLDAVTVTGQTLGEAIRGAAIVNDEVIRPRDRALLEGGSLAILRGSLCPDGAVLKVSAASPGLLQHEGRAVVFRDVDELHATIDDPALEIRPDDVLVLQNGGPVGAAGMPSTVTFPCPSYLLRQGVTDMVRISDARMSGTGSDRRAPRRAGVGRRRAARPRRDGRPDPAGHRRSKPGPPRAGRRDRRAQAGVDAATAERRPRLPRPLRANRPAGRSRLRPRFPRRGVSAGAGGHHSRLNGRDGGCSRPAG